MIVSSRNCLNFEPIRRQRGLTLYQSEAWILLELLPLLDQGRKEDPKTGSLIYRPLQWKRVEIKRCLAFNILQKSFHLNFHFNLY